MSDLSDEEPQLGIAVGPHHREQARKNPNLLRAIVGDIRHGRVKAEVGNFKYEKRSNEPSDSC